jgi:hypothetical protein
MEVRPEFGARVYWTGGAVGGQERVRRNMACVSAGLRAPERFARQYCYDVAATAELLGAPADAINVVVERLTSWPGGPQAWAEAHGASAGNIRRWQGRLAAGDPHL